MTDETGDAGSKYRDDDVVWAFDYLARPDDRLTLAAALGDIEGSTGGAPLRAFIRERGPGTADLVCASILALTKREGAAATPDIRWVLEHATPAARQYASICLFYAGDERGWASGFARLKLKTSTGKTTGEGSYDDSATEIIWLTAYLVKRAQGIDAIAEVRSLLVQRWDRLAPYEQEWLQKNWPGINANVNQHIVTVVPESSLWTATYVLGREAVLFERSGFVDEYLPALLRRASRARQRSLG
jgi:hypothetical protein